MGMGSLAHFGLLSVPSPAKTSPPKPIHFHRGGVLEGGKTPARFDPHLPARAPQSVSSSSAVAAVAVSAAAAAAAVVGKCVSSSSLLRSAGVAVVELVALISGFGGGASRVQ